jgi:hypothetical protein
MDGIVMVGQNRRGLFQNLIGLRLCRNVQRLVIDLP